MKFFLLFSAVLPCIFVLPVAGLNCYYCSDRDAGKLMDGPFGWFTMPSCQHPLQEIVNGTCPAKCYKEVFKNGDIERSCGAPEHSDTNRCFLDANNDGATVCMCSKDYCNFVGRQALSSIAGVMVIVFAFYMQ
ncbi:hypothetical protein M3Y99_00296000 [Aphelenchoides fujianensis]|nr:hypothetical protein M3Y99_01314700 [Aphelenchoides fujianensis]KAI6241756.1 hypothetical protein M3Y99_00296000 [Aphelenchoides fujianensis]